VTYYALIESEDESDAIGFAREAGLGEYTYMGEYEVPWVGGSGAVADILGDPTRAEHWVNYKKGREGTMYDGYAVILYFKDGRQLTIG